MDADDKVDEANHAPSGGFAPRRRTRSCNNKNNLNANKLMQNGLNGNHSNVREDKLPFAIGPSAGNLTTEELIKIHEITGMASKTPVSILQELLSRRGITPSYELVQIEGAIHEPTFRYRVSFTDKEAPITAMGAGRSKKEAKHAAARALIDKLTGIILPESSSAVHCETTSFQEIPSKENLMTYEEKVMGNPIGWLQEMCMSRRLPPPAYTTDTEIGLPHERQFTIGCTISQYREVGKGKSKKIAKRLAAHKMWTRLQETPLDPNHVPKIDDEDQEENRIVLNRYGDIKESYVPTLTSQYSQKVAQFHRTLKGANGDELNKLQTTCLRDPNLNYEQFLDNIAFEHQFEVTYVDIEEKTISNRYQCLVQLSTLPVAVCHGSGLTPNEAKLEAAQNALEYLKIMTNK